MRWLATLIAFSSLASGSVVLDRIAVVVGKHVIKKSDIDRDLRVTDFLNSQKLEFTPAARRKAADRLVEQEIIRNEIDVGDYDTASEDDASKLLADIKRQRFHGNDAQFKAALREYGISEQQLESQLQWQLTVLRFIDQRFRPGILVSDQDIRGYYDKHTADLKKTYGTTDFQTLKAKIQQTLEGEQINKQFFAWLDEQKKATRIQYREDAFQ